MDALGDNLSMGLLALIPMVLSLTVHEYAHAFAAKRLGDDTAESLGRLSLNPLVHADPIGTFLLPVLLASSGFGFGWAKPVPFNPGRFRRSVNVRTGIMVVAAAGPLSNLVLGTLSAAVLAALYHAGTLVSVSEAVPRFLVMMVAMNVGLFLFNMIPIYPLDGQKVLSGLLPMKAAVSFERMSYRFGWLGMVLALVVATRLLAVPRQLILNGLFSVFGVG